MKLPRKNGLEWSTFVVASLLVLGTVAFLARSAWLESDTPPHIAIELGEPSRHGDRFEVPVLVANTGTQSAESVQIEVTSKPDAGDEERATLQIALLPRQSTRRGWVTFTRDPAAGRLTARALGYELP
jgi:uncharacterized protein (TIGR02588 family)